MGEDGDTILSLKVLHIKSEILACKKINTTSCCVNHVYTSLKKKFGSGSIFCVFIASI